MAKKKCKHRKKKNLLTKGARTIVKTGITLAAVSVATSLFKK